MKNKITTPAVAALFLSLSAATAVAQNTNTIEYWSNHGNTPSITLTPTQFLAVCVNLGFTSNASRITDGSPTNFATLTNVAGVSCSANIRTSVVANVATQDVPTPTATTERYAGYYIGNVTNIADVGLLSNITLNIYDDGVLVKSATAGDLLSLALLGGATSGFVYTTVSVPFDEVELQLGSVASLLSSMNVYYAFATGGTGPFDPVGTPLSLESTTLVARATGDGDVHLSWDARKGEHTVVVVERGVAGGGMMPLATMPGAATTFTDEQPLIGQNNTYRLRVRRDNGAVQYSPTVTVFVDGAGIREDWGVFPNPTADVLYLRTSQNRAFVTTLRDATGRVVNRYESKGEPGQHRVWEKASAHTAPGVYFLEVETPDAERWHQRVVLR